MAEVRIALLGAGSMGTVHAAAYAAMPEVSVVGVFSRDPARAAAVAAICKAQPFTDAARLIQRADIDAIDVCLPSETHCDVVMPALDAGKHVFCESPLALELDQALRLRDAARRAGRLLQVGLLMRSVSAYGYVEAAARSGEHGRLLSVTTWRLGSYLHADASDRKAHYGDPSTELMTFDFDFVHWLMGQPQSLSASAARLPDGRPGEISAVLTYPQGRHATVIASGLMPPASPFTVGFRALFERAAFEHLTTFSGGPPKTSFTVAAGSMPAQPVPVINRNPYEVELQRFVACIEGRADPALLDVDRAIEALRLSLATIQSFTSA
ncbi:Predicted dehydrogenase [Rhodospirillales bacterium URHD0017]|nr:Predicted dehydrogenase [Rhodospirillales bacterium URHD0017]